MLTTPETANSVYIVLFGESSGIGINGSTKLDALKAMCSSALAAVECARRQIKLSRSPSIKA